MQPKTNSNEPEEFKSFISEAVKDGEVTHSANTETADKSGSGPDWPQFAEGDADEGDVYEGDEGEEDEGDADDTEGDDEGEEDEGEEDEGEEDEGEEDEGEEDEGEDDPDPKPKKRRRKDARTRISELTAARRSAEEALEQLKAENAALKAGNDPTPKTPTPPPTDEIPEPDLSDLTAPKAADFDWGELDTGYLEAMAEYKAEVAFRRREAKASVERARTEAVQRLEKNFVDNVVNPGKKEFDDFDDVVIEGGKAGKYRLTPTLVSLISESETGAKIMYHLASNPDEASKVSEMSVERQAAYFGRMEARLSSSPEDARKSRRRVTSKAPTPPTAKSRGAGAGKRDNAATTDFAAFERMVQSKG